MPSLSDLVLLEEDHQRISQILDRLRRDANAQATFLVDKNGQQMGLSGSLDGIDPTSLASLTAGNVAATDGLAKLVGEREFAVIFHEGEKSNLHINIVASMAVLVVLFDERSSLGLVRLRVKKASQSLEGALTEITTRAERSRTAYAGAFSPFHEITDEDIDALFG
jgi:predicted regulator of Ras-like GTPase activity (Roadblock/LC7/MglB family)